jgi:hypothetical protein
MHAGQTIAQQQKSFEKEIHGDLTCADRPAFQRSRATGFWENTNFGSCREMDLFNWTNTDFASRDKRLGAVDSTGVGEHRS